MINLLNVNLTRLRKSKTFWILLIFSMAFAIFAKCANYTKIFEEYMTNYFIVAGVIIAIFTSVFLSVEYSDNTIHNKIVIGHKRVNIYLANIITVSLAVIVFYIMFLYMMIITKESDCKLAYSLSKSVKIFTCLILTFFVYSSMFTFISMNISNKVVSSIMNISIAFLLIFSAYQCNDIIRGYYGREEMKILNPDSVDYNFDYLYPTKEEAERSEILLSLNPWGHLMIALIPSVGSHEFPKPTILSFCSICYIIIFTGIGLILFSRKELK